MVPSLPPNWLRMMMEMLRVEHWLWVLVRVMRVLLLYVVLALGGGLDGETQSVKIEVALM